MRRRRGLTLVEVVAAALILATVATTALSVVSSSLTGLRAQSDQLIAQHHARNLMAEWRIQPKELAASGTGTCLGATEWHWTRSVAPYDAYPDAQLRMVTLTLQRNGGTTNTEPPAYSWMWIVRAEKSLGKVNAGA